MTAQRKWELARTGNIKTTSLSNARKALGILGISATQLNRENEVHVIYKNGGFAPICREVLRFIRAKIWDECDYAPTYRALEDILIVIANER